MSVEAIHQLSEIRKEWIEANRKNNFEDGIKRWLTNQYPDNAHFIYELLQNAEDAEASEVQFILNTDSVEFEHNGSRLFSIRDVESITSIGDSPKKDDPTRIGEFGVGFKAVFVYTSTPEIKSGEYHFRIRDLVVPNTEGLSPRTLDKNRTHFLFPFDNPQKSPEKACTEIEKNLRQLGEGALLFLKNIRKIEYRLSDSESGSLERIEKDGDRIEISVRRPESSEPDSTHYLRFEKEVAVNDGNNGDSGNRKPCRIAVAFGMERGKEQKWKIKQLDKGQVCIYFPAEKETSNLRFHLHAPFASTVARASIRDCPANDELRDHLADLVAESMFAIHDQGLLDVAFLATLPNDRDSLESFYEPIQEKLVEVFKNEKLTPMKRGGHAAASGIYQGRRPLSGLINDEDLALILGKDPSLSLWAANAPQRNQEADNFLSLLGIPEWDEEDLMRELSKQPDLIKTWLKDKSDARHQELYALLGDFCTYPLYASEYRKPKYRDRKEELSNLPIVRLSDGATYKKGKDCHFPSDDVEHDEKFSRVAKGVYSSGKNKDQQEKARKFLKDIGVREFGDKERIDLLLETFYQDNKSVELTDEQHLKHISDFIKWWKEGNYTIKFKSYAIFRVEGKDDFYKPIECFLDLPFEDTGLEALFGCSEIPLKNQKYPVSKKYEKINEFIDFAKSLGVMQALETKENKATKMQKDTFRKLGKETHTTIDRDYFLNALIGHGTYWYSEGSPYYIGKLDLKIHKIELSLAVWKTLCRVEEEKLSAFYLPNEANRDKQKREPSFLVNQLKSCKWVPDKDGCFRLPADVTKESLHADFPYSNRNGWLDAIGFGETAKKKSEEYKKREKLLLSLPIEREMVDFASELSPEEQKEMMEDYKRKMAHKRNQSTQQENVLFHEALLKSFIEPGKIATEDGVGYGGSVQNPSRRRDRTSESIAADIENEGKQGARSYFSTVKKWKGKNDQVRVNLTEWYGGQCQICDKTFTQSNGEPYFEGLYLVPYTNAEWIDRVGNVLCLCPWHSAMFQFGPKEVDEDIIQQILRLKVQAEGGDGQPAIKLRSCEEDVEIKFEERHLIDLQEMIKKSQALTKH